MRRICGFWLCGMVLAVMGTAAFAADSPPRSVSGIYPHLAMFNQEGECGTGAVVPWAGRLWAITYGPHLPLGSSDKLYEISPELVQTIRPESVGGTPANRFIHDATQQLCIGPYVIDAEGKIRTIKPVDMPGRLTGTAAHLTDPAHKVYYATMEEGLYEVDLTTLAIRGLIQDGNSYKPGQTKVASPATVSSKLPGYHGKGLYSGQGRVVYANNGDHDPRVTTDPTVPSGALSEWKGVVGEDWSLVRRNQFTEVTGPGGIHGSSHPESDPIWSVGWDAKSLILMVLDDGKWSTYRLPKSSHSYDGAHGWNTEWPRIRDIGEDHFLMTMHGTFWKFPKTFRPSSSAGITPRSNYLKVVGDFCEWQGKVVLGCDDSAKNEFLNKRPAKGEVAGPGESQSNLWFLDHAQLDQFGPVVSDGSVWRHEDVKADVPSDPYLFIRSDAFHYGMLVISNGSKTPLEVILEVDEFGLGLWSPFKAVKIPAEGANWVFFNPVVRGEWIRLRPANDAKNITATFRYRNHDSRPMDPSPLFNGLAKRDDQTVLGGLAHARGGGFRTLRFLPEELTAGSPSKTLGCYDLNDKLELNKVDDSQGEAWTRKSVAIPPSVLTSDESSWIYTDQRGRWRLPRHRKSGSKVVTAPRICREVCTERDLLHVDGTFYELPAENAGGITHVRPVTTHPFAITDYATWRGLLVLTGLSPEAKAGEHIIRSSDDKAGLWVGAVDDLWAAGKPEGVGGVWTNTAVVAGTISDPYLLHGYDSRHVRVSHQEDSPKSIELQIDVTGEGNWTPYQTLVVQPKQDEPFVLPATISGQWIRAKSLDAATWTVEFLYQ